MNARVGRFPFGRSEHKIVGRILTEPLLLFLDPAEPVQHQLAKLAALEF